MAASLAINALAVTLENLDGLTARDYRQWQHYTAISISRATTVKGIPLAARASIHA